MIKSLSHSAVCKITTREIDIENQVHYSRNLQIIYLSADWSLICRLRWVPELPEALSRWEDRWFLHRIYYLIYAFFRTVIFHFSSVISTTAKNLLSLDTSCLNFTNLRLDLAPRRIRQENKYIETEQWIGDLFYYIPCLGAYNVKSFSFL